MVPWSSQGSHNCILCCLGRHSNAYNFLIFYRNKFLSIMDDEEELSDAVQYLHHQGTLLHFTDQALKDVYFLDPQWLCKMMASVIRVPPAGEESLVKNGMYFIGNLLKYTLSHRELVSSVPLIIGLI